MTFKEELKAAFKNCKWAVEELVYDAKMTEANRLASLGVRASLEYLATEYGDMDATLNRIRKLIEKSGRTVDPAKLAKRVYREYEWAVDEVLYLRKEFQVYNLMQSNNAMYAYLKEVHGSGQAVLDEISYMVVNQRKRYKSTNFKTRWFKSRES